MKKGILYIITATLMVLLFSTATLAEETTGYTVADAQNTAIKNSSQSNIDDLDIKQKETALKQAKEDAAMQGDSYGADAVLNSRITKEVKPAEAEANLEAAKRTKQDNINQLKLDVYKSALTILLTEKELDTAKQKLSIQQQKYNFAKVKYEADLIVDTDLHDAEYTLQSKDFDVSNVEDTQKNNYLEFKKLLGLTFDESPVTIRDELKQSPFKVYNLSMDITNAIAADTSVYQKAENLKAKEKTMELTEALFTAGETTYDSNKLDLETVRAEYDNAKIALEVKIRNKYNDLLTLREKIELADKYLALMNKKLSIAEAKLKTGTISQEDLLGAQESRLDAEYAKYKAIYDYNIANAEYDNLIGR